MVTQLYALATPGTKLFRTIASSKNSAVAAGVSCMRLKTPSCTAGTVTSCELTLITTTLYFPAGFLRDILEESARESRRFWMHRQTSSRGDTDDGYSFSKRFAANSHCAVTLEGGWPHLSFRAAFPFDSGAQLE